MRTRTQTIELTGKRYKLHMLIGGALIILGIPACALRSEAGLILFVAGLAWFLNARFLAWWHHG